jgi:hypothetical protein
MATTRLQVFSTKTGSYGLTNSDDLVSFNISSGATATLPTAVGIDGKRFTLKNLDTSTAATILTLNTTSSQTISGRASGNIKLSPGDFIEVYSDGANYKIIKHQETITFTALGITNSGTVTTTGTGDVLTWSTVEIDTHGAYSAGVWTCPAPGLYDIALGTSGAETATTAACNVLLTKNGSTVRSNAAHAPATSGRAIEPNTHGKIRLVTGDLIRGHSLSPFGNLTHNSSNACYLQINRVGN